MGLAQPAKALEPGRGQDQGISGALGKPAQPGVDVAADLDHPQVGPDRGDLGSPAWTAGGDPRRRRQAGERRWRPPDEHVAGVGPRQEGGQYQPRRRQGWQVLRRMNRQFGSPLEQCLLELLDEHALAR